LVGDDGIEKMDAGHVGVERRHASPERGVRRIQGFLTSERLKGPERCSSSDFFRWFIL
jgi:hypothetical protein